MHLNGIRGLNILILSIFLTGCAFDDVFSSEAQTYQNNVSMETISTGLTNTNKIENAIETLPTKDQVLGTETKIIEGISDLETVKVETAFIEMIDLVERDNNSDKAEVIEHEETLNDLISPLTVGELLEAYQLSSNQVMVANTYKVEARKKLEEQYKGNIPVDESQVINLLPNELLAPRGLDIKYFEQEPTVTIDNMGIVDESGLHIRIKGIDGRKQRVTLQYSNGETAWVDGWFMDQSEDSTVYWNAYFHDIVDLEKIAKNNFIIENIKSNN